MRAEGRGSIRVSGGGNHGATTLVDIAQVSVIGEGAGELTVHAKRTCGDMDASSTKVSS